MLRNPFKLIVRPRAVFVLGLAGLVCLGGAVSVAGAPGSFELVFDARHVPATIPSNSGVMHVGTFTASAPFCASGTVTDLAFENPGGAAVRRSYTCGDGSGSMTMRSTIPLEEHTTGGSGSWRILEGTGRYATLRGNGRYTSVFLGGDPADFASVTFRSTSTGVVDLDSEAPRLLVSLASATKLPRSANAYAVRVRFSARDNVPGNNVAYRLGVSAGYLPLATRAGTTRTGTVALTFRVRPQGKAQNLRIKIVASDPLDNERKLVRSLELPRSRR